MSDSTPAITKRRVTKVNYRVLPPEPGGKPIVVREEVKDFVRPDFLEAYVAEARLHWQQVDVSDEPDAGPGGYHGETHVPAHLDHPLAGQTFAATYPPGEEPTTPTQVDEPQDAPPPQDASTKPAKEK